MPTTPLYAFRYPAITDPADVPLDMQELALDVENKIASMPSGGDLTRLVDTVLAANAATIDLTSIAATYADLILILDGIITAGIDDLLLRVNGDTGNNYNYSTSGAAAQEDKSSIKLGRIRDNSAWGNPSSMDAYEISILDYSRTDRWKNIRSNGGFTSQSGYVSGETYMSYAQWRNVAAINRVTLLLATTPSFKTGTRVRLYGRN